MKEYLNSMVLKTLNSVVLKTIYIYIYIYIYINFHNFGGNIMKSLVHNGGSWWDDERDQDRGQK